MLRQCLPVASLRLQAGKGGGGPRGSLEPGEGAGGGKGRRRSWPGRAVAAAAAAAAGAGQTAQPLPPGASLSSPRSWRLQNSLSLSAPSLLPLRSPPPPLPVPLQLRAPGPGRPEPGPAHGGWCCLRPGGGGTQAEGHGGVRGFLGILGIRPCPVRRLLAAAWSGGGTRVWGWEPAEPRRASPWDSPPRYRGLTGDTRGEPDAGENPRTHVGSPGRENSLLV